jgi:hypothetical protein
MSDSKSMGRPLVYDPNNPRRPRTITLTDELWNALKDVAGEGKRAEYIEKMLREIPEVATLLEE